MRDKNISTVVNYENEKDERIVVNIDELLLALTHDDLHIKHQTQEGK